MFYYFVPAPLHLVSIHASTMAPKLPGLKRTCAEVVLPFAGAGSFGKQWQANQAI